MPDDQFLALLWVGLVVGALLLVGLVRAVVRVAAWAQGVKLSPAGAAPYVEKPAPAPAPESRSRQEPEPEREPERAEPEPEPKPAPKGKIYTDDQIDRIKKYAEDRGAARALGLFIGRGLLDPGQQPELMELLLGPRGRRHQAVRPIVDKAIKEGTPEAEPARLVSVNDGREVEV